MAVLAWVRGGVDVRVYDIPRPGQGEQLRMIDVVMKLMLVAFARCCEQHKGHPNM